MVIFLLALFTTISIMVVNQLGNQMKSITNRHDDIQIKYTAEAGIERTIREVCDEISNKLSDESSSTKNIQENNIQKAYLNKENYAYKSSSISNIQNELSSIKDNLNSISEKINTQDLNNIKSKIDSIRFSDSIIEDIDSIRNDILNIAINSNNYKEIESTIYSCIEHIYKATDFAYIEKNKYVDPVYLKDSNYWEDSVYNNSELINLIEGTKFGNGFRNIANKLGQIVYIDKIIDKTSWSCKEATDIRSYGEKIYTKFQSGKPEDNSTLKFLNEYAKIFSDKNYENLSSPNIVSQLKKINSSIEDVINDINKVQSDLNKLYLNNTNIDSLKTVIDDALKSYDNIKNEIRWLQKKLDLSPLNSDSNKEPDSEGNTGTGGNSGSEGNTGTGGSSGSNGNTESDGNSSSNKTEKITINLKEYTKEFEVQNSTYKYEIQYVDKKDEITVEKDENNNILNVKDDLVLEIISNAYKENDDLVYKIKSKIIFKIDVNNGVNVEYDIESYERIQENK